MNKIIRFAFAEDQAREDLNYSWMVSMIQQIELGSEEFDLSPYSIEEINKEADELAKLDNAPMYIHDEFLNNLYIDESMWGILSTGNILSPKCLKPSSLRATVIVQFLLDYYTDIKIDYIKYDCPNHATVYGTIELRDFTEDELSVLQESKYL